jgi:hypothetical protein
MATEAPVNGVSTTLASPYITSTSQTTCVLTSATGFTNAQYHCLITDGTNYEIVEATGLSGTTLTIVRHSEAWNGASTSYTFAIGSTITVIISVASIQGLIAAGLPAAAIPLSTVTAAGDLIQGTGTGAVARVALGTLHYMLAAGASAVGWVASAVSTLTTTGDLLYASAANTLARLGIGATGTRLVVAGGVPTWAVTTISIPFTFAWSGLVVVPSGATGFIPPMAFPIPSGQSAKLVGVFAVLRGGTNCVLAVNQNGAAVSGLSTLTVTTTGAYTAVTTPPSVANDDLFAPVVASISGTPDGLSLTLIVTLTI